MIILTVCFEKPRFRYNFRTQDKLLELMFPEAGVFCPDMEFLTSFWFLGLLLDCRSEVPSTL